MHLRGHCSLLAKKTGRGLRGHRGRGEQSGVSDRCGRRPPKIALGDDVDRNGVYTFSFEVHNYSDSAVIYTVGGTVQTDGAEVNGQIGGVDVWQTTEQPYRLSGTISRAVPPCRCGGGDQNGHRYRCIVRCRQGLSEYPV